MSALPRPKPSLAAVESEFDQSHVTDQSQVADQSRVIGQSQVAGQSPVTKAELTEALRFVHLVETQSQARMAELSATVHALVETLVAQGSLPIERYQQRRHLKVIQEGESNDGFAGVQLTDAPDKYTVKQPDIDCQARLPLCQARCCGFSFALSVQDIDEGVVRWEYGQPYRIKRNADGSCHHLREHTCQIYEQRPAVCRTYDCRSDKRIWLDFDKRIVAPRA